MLGEDTNWAQTSYNANFRKYYAGPGFKYDPVLDEFIPPKPPAPYPSWIYDEEHNSWKPPVNPTEMPDKDHMLKWNEETVSWEVIVREQSTSINSSENFPSAWLTDPNNPYFSIPGVRANG